MAPMEDWVDSGLSWGRSRWLTWQPFSGSPHGGPQLLGVTTGLQVGSTFYMTPWALNSPH